MSPPLPANPSSKGELFSGGSAGAGRNYWPRMRPACLQLVSETPLRRSNSLRPCRTGRACYRELPGTILFHALRCIKAQGRAGVPKKGRDPTATSSRAAPTDKEGQPLRLRRGWPSTSYLRPLAYGAGGGKASGYGWVCPLHSVPGAAGPGPAFAWTPILARKPTICP
jgi:hypothetical protein